MDKVPSFSAFAEVQDLETSFLHTYIEVAAKNEKLIAQNTASMTVPARFEVRSALCIVCPHVLLNRVAVKFILSSDQAMIIRLSSRQEHLIIFVADN